MKKQLQAKRKATTGQPLGSPSQGLSALIQGEAMWCMRYKNETRTWEVGYFTRQSSGHDKWNRLYSFRTQGEAADKIHYLHGGKKY